MSFLPSVATFVQVITTRKWKLFKRRTITITLRVYHGVSP